MKTRDVAPEASPDAYSKFADDSLLLAESGEPAPPLAQRVHAALRALILDPEYPCVGSRSALNQGSYRFAMYDTLGSEETTAALARDLRLFTEDSVEGEFTTFIACFDSPKSITPEDFETLLWQQLESLHDSDSEAWDPDVSPDPTDQRFSFSFGGTAFFVVGLSPQAERWARRFPWPLMAFNPHAQFEKLRNEGRFERIRDTIRERDIGIEGDINPNAEDFGSHTEARQYSGRAVPEDWKPPVTFVD